MGLSTYTWIGISFGAGAAFMVMLCWCFSYCRARWRASQVRTLLVDAHGGWWVAAKPVGAGTPDSFCCPPRCCPQIFRGKAEPPAAVPVGAARESWPAMQHAKKTEAAAKGRKGDVENARDSHEKQHSAVASSATIPAPDTLCPDDVVIEDAYDIEELDDDWKPIMKEIDRRVQAKGHNRLTPQETAVAIKHLLTATGSRGVTFAMDETIKNVLHFRVVSAKATRR